MGTRSTTHIYDGIISNETHLVSAYKQYDGYLSGYGKDLLEFLLSKSLVNGYNSTQENNQYANGMGCLSAQLIQHFKTGIGGYYITNKADTQEYDYHVYILENEVNIKVVENDLILFAGTLLEFGEYLTKQN